MSFFSFFGSKYIHPYTLFLIVIISSCTPAKNIAYFEDLKLTSKYSQIIDTAYEVKLQPDDIIQIFINSVNPEATAIFNLGNAVPAAGGASQPTQIGPAGNINRNVVSDPTAGNKGYLIDKAGDIDFPVLGRLKVTGLTTRQLKEQLKLKLDKYLSEPIVNVRLLNYRITILGEVARPGTYAIPGEQITIVEALGMAGDLTIYGKRENVLLIREENGERKFIRLNLNSSNVLRSPYYYLKQNDALYIEPGTSKIDTLENGFYRKAQLAVSFLGVIAIITYRLLIK